MSLSLPYRILRRARYMGSAFVLGSFVAAGTFRVDRLPHPGESLLASAVAWEPGGKGFNVAAGLRRLGVEVDGLIPVGTDHLAALADPALRRMGLPAAMIRHHPGSTGIGVGFVGADGENCLAVHPGANLLLSRETVRSAAASLTSSAMVIAQFEIGDDAIAEAFVTARVAGVPTLLNPSPFRMTQPEILSGILASTTILVVNQTEAEALLGFLYPGRAGSNDLRAVAGKLAEALHARGVEALVITFGAAGARIVLGGSTVLDQPAFPVTAIDTIGAGDAFIAGLATGLLTGRSWSECGRMAAACGALAVTRSGVLDALPDPGEVAEFLCAYPPPMEAP
ncbi:ribokinase [Methylobacterium sp. Leaf86]|uniref:ribokinase n=2 Tax=unclassified Methylobacterium TaxID=2615210 RepID=UPI001FCD1135|nr:ribokinase [Methylobacterium sp. Leaf86]